MINLIGYVIYLAKIILSVILGLIIGQEREGQEKPAGFRDVPLITLGACLLAIIALELLGLDLVRYDIGRIIAYTVVSIGFLGSGVIIYNRGNVEGITTATSLWCSTIVGLLCGLGYYGLAIISTIAIYFILKLKYFREKLREKYENYKKSNKK